MNDLRKKGVNIQPVEIEGRKIAKTFWGQAWCDHMESFSDFANRLPRGRTYVRNGSVCHLAISKGKVDAKVSGSEIYNVKITIKTLPSAKWEALKSQCSGQIGSLLELLRGDLSDNIMEVVTDRDDGLFPLPGEMKFQCDCPDWANMCKHVAAVMYGVGARLDQEPALLFQLRGVNHEELIRIDTQIAVPEGTSGNSKRLDQDELANVFGIDLEPNKKTDNATNDNRGQTSPAKKSAKSKPVNKSTNSKPVDSAAEPNNGKRKKSRKSPTKKKTEKNK